MAEIDHLSPDAPEIEVQRLVARLSMLQLAVVDIAHPTVEGHRIVGYLITPDEHSFHGEGVQMMKALERLADIDLEAVQTGIEDRVDDPFAIPPYRPLETT